MIAHLVLFRPRADLSASARHALVATFEAALRQIPSIRRARVGRRLLMGRAYEASRPKDYQYAAVLEFDDVAGLADYLDHPFHQELASRFFAACEAAAMYDFELQENTAGLGAASGDTH